MSTSKKANKEKSRKIQAGVQKNENSKSGLSRRVSPAKGHSQSAQIKTTVHQTDDDVNAGKPAGRKTGNLRINILRIIALVAVIGMTVFIYNIRDRVVQFSALGYPGVFLVALLANATILLPAPGVAIVYAMGAVFNPIGVGVAAGTGGAIGELSGYLAGFSGQAIAERTDVYDRTKPWIDAYGGWAILVLSAIPNPFFDAAGIAAGIAKMPLRTFFFFVWIGQLIKMTLFAYAGRLSLDWLAQYLN